MYEHPCSTISSLPSSPLMTMLRSLPRAGNSSLYLRPCLRTTASLSRSPKAACTVVIQQHQTRPASTGHAISNPTLAGIEKRWEEMPPQEQADLWMALRDRMKIDWHDLTLQEKKAGGCSCSILEWSMAGQTRHSFDSCRACSHCCLRPPIDPKLLSALLCVCTSVLTFLFVQHTG